MVDLETFLKLVRQCNRKKDVQTNVSFALGSSGSPGETMAFIGSEFS